MTPDLQRTDPMSQGPSYRSHEEILEGISRREPAAFETLFDRYADLIFGFSLKLSGREDTARDILQRAFIEALPHIKEAMTEQAVGRVLLREATLGIQALREGEGVGNPRDEIPLEELFPKNAGGRADSARDWSLDPDEEEWRPEEKRLLRELIVEMPLQYGAVLVLCDTEEMDIQDVADILNISPRVVKTRLHRARLLLRRELTGRLLDAGAKKRSDRS